MLGQAQPRDDYKEMLELIIIILGKDPAFILHYKFKIPGAFHHARFMAKLIYVLKLYLFRVQLILLESEHESIIELCNFLIHIYVRAWFLCPMVTIAPAEDLDLLYRLELYKFVNFKVAILFSNKYTFTSFIAL